MNVVLYTIIIVIFLTKISENFIEVELKSKIKVRKKIRTFGNLFLNGSFRFRKT